MFMLLSMTQQNMKNGEDKKSCRMQKGREPEFETNSEENKLTFFTIFHIAM